MTSWTSDPRWLTIWPMFALGITAPGIEMRPLSPEVVPDLIDVALAGVHDRSFMPFEIPWTDERPDVIAREAWRWWAATWTTWSVENWRLPMVVYAAGELAGIQDVASVGFPTTKTVATGSWLGQRFQGRGIGTTMRRAVLQLAFDHFGAQRADTGAWADNERSIGVTHRLGYRPNGDVWRTRRGELTRSVRYCLDRHDFDAIRSDDIVISGFPADPFGAS